MHEASVKSGSATSPVIVTALATSERTKLRVLISRTDGLAMILCALIDFDTIGKLTSEGAHAFKWLVFMAVAFFMPYALLCAEMVTAFAVELMQRLHQFPDSASYPTTSARSRQVMGRTGRRRRK